MTGRKGRKKDAGKSKTTEPTEAELFPPDVQEALTELLEHNPTEAGNIFLDIQAGKLKPKSAKARIKKAYDVQD